MAAQQPESSDPSSHSKDEQFPERPKIDIDPEIKKLIEESKKKATEIVRKLVKHSNAEYVEPIPLKINEIVKNAIPIAKEALTDAHELKLNLAESLPITNIDEAAIEQILINLLTNARDAMEANPGSVEISTEKVDAADIKMAKGEPNKNGYIALRVSDTGVGITEATYRKMFNPFFSTKPRSNGTGIGLFEVSTIMKRHKGVINVSSTLGEGATFHLLFPIVDEESMKNAAEPKSNYEGKCILLVEDEPPLRNLLKTVLEQFKYRVLEAESCDHALEVWEEADTHIDILITDVYMPKGISGIELCKRLKEKQDDLIVVVMSGYSAQLVAKKFKIPDNSEYIPKPFSPMVLAKTVNGMVDGKITSA